jgi:hypothetical protein
VRTTAPRAVISAACFAAIGSKRNVYCVSLASSRSSNTPGWQRVIASRAETAGNLLLLVSNGVAVQV